jgi:uncharacterized membrane protein (UPF0127 family)
MGRERLAPGTGMLFAFGGETTTGFYMYRTLIPLSIMFVRHGRVVGVHEMTPCPADDPATCQVYYAGSPYTDAVEAGAGTFTTAGVAVGDRVVIAVR